ncbi:MULTISPECIES: flagellar basal body P-ring formation chaperone FlgA [unclassified Shewanella]|uniref:flagellar basal body P-ring formation chaperone FlgA n=1 Tax=unclassified Shewanella TaxID=196818 RepID=UPI000C85CB2F|nr:MULTISPECIES: flagellar basal body P-ring formation chaperone FlgA [unclassified Shewanella]MDO6618580.1 flagellar basal body P-ring formation chaperone FlgA [Shewanella sp. 6_MG-2023]MDO6641788.1 flagellar basal body P-ring formation chaperone FlgA [Shewanella sp. 5_MG-2023]MDO6678495.1 flagellar basal body P-ring formation chaperone FlgA [Shewanella sp. 4_MG-2023]MDO6774763.1 flagellar basal body P-ring formation chaperone FlgA [Shewanella sp. 3_MG-2023]PMG32050.1 flagella basal body P-ri
MKKNILLLIIIFLSLPVNASEDATITYSLSTITELAKEVVAKKIAKKPNAVINISPQNLDGRLTPPRCLPPISVEMASDREISRTNTVKISCISPDYDYPWQMFISVKVEVMYPVVTALGIIEKGELITADNVAINYVDQHSIRGQFFSEISQLLGTRSKRRVSAKAPLLNNNLCFVCKGDSVSIYAKTNAFEIKTAGEALRDGNIGDAIRVRNSNSNRRLDVIVTGVGEVEVRM